MDGTESGSSPSGDLGWLRVDLDALARRGVRECRVAGTLPVAFLADALEGTDAQVRATATVDLAVTVQPDGVVLARGRLRGGFVVPCGRCLEDAAVDAGTEICATFLPRGGRAAEPEPEEGADLAQSDLDLYRYTPPVLDLADVVREHWAVAYPMRALCGRDQACRGLCGTCGYELNRLGEDARTCPGCGRALRDVSQRPSDRDLEAPGADPEVPWKAALAKVLGGEGA